MSTLQVKVSPFYRNSNQWHKAWFNVSFPTLAGFHSWLLTSAPCPRMWVQVCRMSRVDPLRQGEMLWLLIVFHQSVQEEWISGRALWSWSLSFTHYNERKTCAVYEGIFCIMILLLLLGFATRHYDVTIFKRPFDCYSTFLSSLPLFNVISQ